MVINLLKFLGSLKYCIGIKKVLTLMKDGLNVTLLENPGFEGQTSE